MDIEVKENSDREADRFLGFPTLVQFESLPGVSEADFERRFEAQPKRFGALTIRVIAATFCTEPAPSC